MFFVVILSTGLQFVWIEQYHIHTSATLCWFPRDRKTTISHTVQTSAKVTLNLDNQDQKQAFSTSVFGEKQTFVLGCYIFFSTAHCMKNERYPGVWFSLSFTAEKVSWRRGTQGSHFPISSCHVHHPHLTRTPGEGRPPPLSPPPQRAVNQLGPPLRLLQPTHTDTLHETFSLTKTRCLGEIMTTAGYAVLVSLCSLHLLT